MTEPPPQWNAPDAPPPYTGTSGYGYGVPEAPPQQSWYAPPPPPGVVPLRPLGVGELLDGSIKVLRRYPRPTLGLSAAISAVVTLVNVLLVLAFDQVDTTTSEEIDIGAGLSSGPGTILSYLAGLVLTGALVAVVGKAVLGQAVSTPEVWATVRGRLWALLGLSLLTGLIVAAPAAVGVIVAVVLALATGGAGLVVGIPLAIGGFGLSAYFYTRLALAPAALVLEKAGIKTALGRSGTLVRGAWWRTFWILVLTSILAAVLSAILAVPFGIIGVVLSSADSTGFLVAQQVAGGLANVVVAPFVAGVHALLYVDRRMRAEGLDVALAAAAAGVPPA